MNLPVVHYHTDHVPNPNPKGKTPFKKFWKVRAALLATCQKHGTTGPEDKQPIYWLVEDQHNDHLYQNVAVYQPEGWTTAWINSVAETLQKHSGWGVSVGHIEDGHLLIFADRLMVTGPTFTGAGDLDSIVHAARDALVAYDERKNGSFRRQTAYVQKLLPTAMQEASGKTFTHLVTFDRYRLYDKPALWILQTPTSDELYLESEGGECSSCPVTEDAQIHDQYCEEFFPYTDVRPPFWLTIHLADERSPQKYRMMDEDGGHVGDVAVSKIITDDELRA